MSVAAIGLAAVLALFLALELGARFVAGRPCRVGFYGSIPRERVRALQAEVGVRGSRGPGWVHLGWIADPERERYQIEREVGGRWEPLGQARYGSFLASVGGRLRVRAVGPAGERVLGEATLEPAPPLDAPVEVPRIAGPWRPLFRPTRAGDYVNDHCLYRDARGGWRLVGITGPGPGDYARERRLAVGASEGFPPPDGMREEAPVADFGELAWAPCVVRAQDAFWLFWSPHVLRRMRSPDGVAWGEPEVVLASTQHPFFRDAMVVEAAPGQWLLYATARGRWFSRVDLYQSFDLRHWQYVGPALRTGFGSERNAPMASTESPRVVRRAGRWYLTVTYTNDTGGLAAALLALRILRRKASYNDTLVFHAESPYDFGCYRGRRRAPTLLTQLAAHAPALIEHPETGAWWITTAGWPWAATLTRGEVAVAPLAWEPLPPVAWGPGAGGDAG